MRKQRDHCSCTSVPEIQSNAGNNALLAPKQRENIVDQQNNNLYLLRNNAEGFNIKGTPSTSKETASLITHTHPLPTFTNHFQHFQHFQQNHNSLQHSVHSDNRLQTATTHHHDNHEQHSPRGYRFPLDFANVRHTIELVIGDSWR